MGFDFLIALTASGIMTVFCLGLWAAARLAAWHEKKAGKHLASGKAVVVARPPEGGLQRNALLVGSGDLGRICACSHGRVPMEDYPIGTEVDIVYAVPECGWPIVELKDHPPLRLSEVLGTVACVMRTAAGIMVLVSAAAFLSWVSSCL